jgi:uncharacterized protein YyaL (SSP411 family)
MNAQDDPQDAHPKSESGRSQGQGFSPSSTRLVYVIAWLAGLSGIAAFLIGGDGLKLGGWDQAPAGLPSATSVAMVEAGATEVDEGAGARADVDVDADAADTADANVDATGTAAEDPGVPAPAGSLFAIRIEGPPPYERAKGEANRLASSNSAYLRSAAEQPVSWLEFGAEAFTLAEELDRPIYLDIGAVWCHWCHVMDRESYEDETVAAYINAHFIPVKVDRDARPDIDRRYQAAVQAISQSGGWPLTAFLTKKGRVFYGGTYFPPRSSEGRTGLDVLLPQVVDIYATKRAEVFQQADQLHAQLGSYEQNIVVAGSLNRALVDGMAERTRDAADPEGGGWGSQGTKFPNLGAVALMLRQYERSEDPRWLSTATQALDAMASGGMRDYVFGGLYRYSTDPNWTVPHFEKMSYVNAEALFVYARAWRMTGEARYRETGMGIADYVLETASNPKTGGFYATQDADLSLDDDGAYFTWTLAEARAVLDPADALVVLSYFGIAAKPSAFTHELPDRNVLRIVRELGPLASELGISEEEARLRLDSGLRALHASRSAEPAPFVDKTVYANWNGLMISAFLEAASIFEAPELEAFALKTSDFILDEMYRPGAGFYHAYTESGGAEIEALFDDQAQMAIALLDAHEASGDARYLKVARDVMDYSIDTFWDAYSGGFNDIVPSGSGLAALDRPGKPIFDSPTPAGNPAAAVALIRLAEIDGDARYRDLAEQTLEAFAGGAGQYDAMAAGYALAIDRFLETED